MVESLISSGLVWQVDANEFLRELEHHADVDDEDKLPNTALHEVKYGSPMQHRMAAKRAAAAKQASK